MSRHDGRLVFLDVDMNFAVTNLATTGNPVPSVGATVASRDLVRLDMMNTNAADCIRVYAGMTAATAALIAKVGPGASVSVHTLVSQGQQLFFKSTVGAVSSGRLFIVGYN